MKIQEEHVIDPQPITFSFGENWLNFLRTISADAIDRAMADTCEWLPDEQIRGRTVIDIGCGSGLHSLAFLKRKALQVTSIDIDPRSVQASRQLWEHAGRPMNWQIDQGSILGESALSQQRYDVVYSWGVLHHTGQMWTALERARGLLKEGGLFWISLYAKGPNYSRDLATKQAYNAASKAMKGVLRMKYVLILMLHRLRAGRNPWTWNEQKARGMDTWHDIVDWLGGLPYEVASVDEVVAFMAQRGCVVQRVQAAPEGSCHTFLFRSVTGQENSGMDSAEAHASH
jgi:2-polyprenyl-3-methyl-5-hydroxy-6-metoxy-1,4-benzoquinol methylase